MNVLRSDHVIEGEAVGVWTNDQADTTPGKSEALKELNSK